MNSPTGRLASFQPEMQNLPGSPASWIELRKKLELDLMRFGVPIRIIAGTNRDRLEAWRQELRARA